MIRFGPGLERKQAVLGRIVEIGAELFVMVATVVHAKALVDKDPSDRSPYELADLFCRQARTRIRERFDHLFANNDAATYRVAQDAMEGAFEWLEEGLLTTDWTPQPDSGAKAESTLEGVASAESQEESAPTSIREPAGQA
jgi:hypothetical protein